MSYISSFSRYQAKFVIEFLFRQLMASWTLRFIYNHLEADGRQAEKEGRTEIQKIEYLENEKSFLDEIKSIFHSFWRAIIWWKKLIKIADTSFKLVYFMCHRYTITSKTKIEKTVNLSCPAVTILLLAIKAESNIFRKICLYAGIHIRIL